LFSLRDFLSKRLLEIKASFFRQFKNTAMENTDRQNNAFPKHRGSEELIDKYNINDQAHSDSSAKDFVKTVSEFHHADETDNETQLPEDNQLK
jgi:hypothetical protein